MISRSTCMLWAFTCLPIIALSCAHPVYKAYPGSEQPLTDVAVVYACGDLTISGVDDRGHHYDSGYIFSVLPGVHRLEGCYYYTNQISTTKYEVISGTCPPLEFRADAGREYAIWLDKQLGQMRVREEPDSLRRIRLPSTSAAATGPVKSIVPTATAHSDHWRLVSSGCPLRGLWGIGEDDLIGIGSGGLIYRFEGDRAKVMPAPTDDDLSAIHGFSSDDVFAVGLKGTILHWDGSVWRTVRSDTTLSLSGVWGSSSRDLFVVGSTILHYDGSNWTSQDRPGKKFLSDIWGTSSTDVFAVGEGGTVLHYDGRQWTAMKSHTDRDLNAVWGSSGDNVFAVGYEGTIVRYDGAEWRPMKTGAKDALLKVAGASGTNVYCVSSVDRVYHYDGVGWSELAEAPNRHLAPRLFTGLWVTSVGEVVVSWSGGFLLRYRDGAWRTTQYAADELNGIWAASPTQVFAVGSGGMIVRGAGDEWRVETSGSTQNLYAVWGSSERDVFAAGDSGTVLHDNGSGWSPLQSGLPSSIKITALWGGSSVDVFAIGHPGTILHYDGRNWKSQQVLWGAGEEEARVLFEDDLTLRDVWGCSASDVYAVGGREAPDLGCILHYDGGNGWRLEWAGTGGELKGISCIPFGGILVVGNQGGVITNEGGVWAVHPRDNGPGLNDGDIWASSKMDMYSVDYCKVRHYDGNSWRAEQVGDCGLFAISGTGSGDVYMVGESGAIYYRTPGR
jgi:hypothetical protein